LRARASQDDAEQRQGQRQGPLVGRDKLEDGRKQERYGDCAEEPGKHGAIIPLPGPASTLPGARKIAEIFAKWRLAC
jgi:hypothetical protein